MNNVEEISANNRHPPTRDRHTGEVGRVLRFPQLRARVWGLASESDSEFVFWVQGVWWWTGRRVELLYRVTEGGEGGAGGGIEEQLGEGGWASGKGVEGWWHGG